MGLEGSSEAGFMLIMCGFLLFCFVVSLPVWWVVWRIAFPPYSSPSVSSGDLSGYDPLEGDTWEDIRREQKEEQKKEWQDDDYMLG